MKLTHHFKRANGRCPIARVALVTGGPARALCRMLTDGAKKQKALLIAEKGFS